MHHLSFSGEAADRITASSAKRSSPALLGLAVETIFHAPKVFFQGPLINANW
jgi:hypothetical protein